MPRKGKEEYACVSLEAAAAACIKHQHKPSQKHFQNFLRLLKAHQLSPPEHLAPTQTDPKHAIVVPDKLPGDIIPVLLYSLASCWRQHGHPIEADAAITSTLAVITAERGLSFLRQNVFQECARYYADSEVYDKADELFSLELQIVQRKGSNVLLDFVTASWLINRGDLHTAHGEFENATQSYEKALALIESQWAPNQDLVAKLYTSWLKLEDAEKARKKC